MPSTTTTTTALHITPVGGAWAVKLDEAAEPTGVHPTRWLAVAIALEMLQDEDEAEVLIHGKDGRVRSSLTIRQVVDDPDEDEDAKLRAEAERITPRRAQLDALIALGSTSTIDYSLEDDELPC